METRSASRNTRLAQGHVAVIKRVLKGGRLAEEQKTILLSSSKDCKCNPIRLNGDAPLIEPFVDQRKGHVATVHLPGGPTKMKLVDIQVVVPQAGH